MKAWTYVYNAFAIGTLNRATGFEFQPAESDRVELGKGFYGYVLQSPKGKTIVVEESSGAIVGNSLSEVQKDIATGDEDILNKQVEEACKENVNIVSEEKFWEVYDKRG